MLCLAITGFECDPDRVTDLLKIAPTEVARRGTLSRSGRLRTFNGWWLEAHADRVTNGGQHNTALEQLLSHLREASERFRELREMVKPTSIMVYGGLYHKPDEQCGVWLDPGQMHVLASCGIGWGLDLFTDGEPQAGAHSS